MQAESPITVACIQMEPKIGVAAVSELVSVGPIILMLEMASVVESAGRMMPTMANISAAVVSQYQLLRKNGANSRPKWFTPQSANAVPRWGVPTVVSERTRSALPRREIMYRASSPPMLCPIR